MILSYDFRDPLCYILDTLSSPELIGIIPVCKGLQMVIINMFKSKSKVKHMYGQIALKPIYMSHVTPRNIPKLSPSQYATAVMDLFSDYYIMCINQPDLYSKRINKYIGGTNNIEVVKLVISKKTAKSSQIFDTYYDLFAGACRYGAYDVAKYIISVYSGVIRASHTPSYFHNRRNFSYYAAMLGKNNFVVIKGLINNSPVYSKYEVIQGAIAYGHMDIVTDILSTYIPNVREYYSFACCAYKRAQLDMYLMISKLDTIHVNNYYEQICKSGNTQWILGICQTTGDANIFAMTYAIQNGNLSLIKQLVSIYKYSRMSLMKAFSRSITCNNMIVSDWLLSYINDTQQRFSLSEHYIDYSHITDDTNISAYIDYLTSGYKKNNLWIDSEQKRVYVKYIGYITFSIHEYLCVSLFRKLYKNTYGDNSHILDIYNLCKLRGYGVVGAVV